MDLSTAQEGDTVQLPEGGELVDFRIAKINYEPALNGDGRVLLVRKNAYAQVTYNSSSDSYAGGVFDTYLNETYKPKLAESVQSAMGTTEFYYTPGNGNSQVSTLSRAVFLLSGTEFGKTDSDMNVEGSPLPIANSLIPAYFNGGESSQWTRSSERLQYHYKYYISSNGELMVATGATTSGVTVVPAFTLPATFSTTYYVGPDGIHDAQEYIEGGTFTDFLGNDIPVPRIETGSYVGTGTYGQSNPTTLTFTFEPKLVFASSTTHYYSTAPMVRNSGRSSTGTNSSNAYITVQWTDNGVSWYGSNADYQLNYSGITYYYVAIG